MSVDISPVHSFWAYNSSYFNSLSHVQHLPAPSPCPRVNSGLIMILFDFNPASLLLWFKSGITQKGRKISFTVPKSHKINRKMMTSYERKFALVILCLEGLNCFLFCFCTSKSIGSSSSVVCGTVKLSGHCFPQFARVGSAQINKTTHRARWGNVTNKDRVGMQMEGRGWDVCWEGHAMKDVSLHFDPTLAICTQMPETWILWA